MRKHFQICLLFAASACFVLTITFPVFAAPQQAASSDTSTIVEKGKFTLHKFEQAIGEETYEIKHDGDSLAAKVDFKFTDRGSAVPLAVTFRGAQDLTPQSFEIKGRTARSVAIDEAVTIDAGKSTFAPAISKVIPMPPAAPFSRSRDMLPRPCRCSWFAIGQRTVHRPSLRLFQRAQ